MRLGIRREDKNEWEARVPIIPSDAKRLVDQGIDVYLQPSTLRIYPDQEYLDVGRSNFGRPEPLFINPWR